MACRVASVILHRLSRNGDCFPSLEYLAKAVGTFNPDSKNKGRSTVQRALKELVKHGHLEILANRWSDNGRRLPNVYVPKLKAVAVEEPRDEVGVTASCGHPKPVDKDAKTPARDHMKCADGPHEVRGLTASCGTNPYKNPLNNPSRARSAPKKLGRVEPGRTTEPIPEPTRPRKPSVPIRLAKHLARMPLPQPSEAEPDAYATPDQWSALLARLKGGM
jgi:hypothetical protein